MSLCNHRYSATQYALLSALASVGRVMMGPPAGVLVEHLGWAQFFVLAFIVSLPGLAVLMMLRRTVEAYDSDHA